MYIPHLWFKSWGAHYMWVRICIYGTYRCFMPCEVSSGCRFLFLSGGNGTGTGIKERIDSPIQCSAQVRFSPMEKPLGKPLRKSWSVRFYFSQLSLCRARSRMKAVILNLSDLQLERKGRIAFLHCDVGRWNWILFCLEIFAFETRSLKNCIWTIWLFRRWLAMRRRETASCERSLAWYMYIYSTMKESSFFSSKEWDTLRCPSSHWCCHLELYITSE